MRISFIIPCHNVSKTVRRCLDSIYALPFREEEFEVIVVNDASTDDTLQIILEYGKNHQNLIIVNHLVNRNIGAARNSGLSMAKGECISLVDSDDEVRPGIATVLKRMEEEELDMIAMRSEQYSCEGFLMKEMSLPISEDVVFSGVQFQIDHSYWQANVWSYLYSKDLVELVRYPFVEGVFYEDVDFLCAHLLFAERMSYSDDCGYRYYVNTNSITHTFSFKHASDYALLGTRMLSLCKKSENRSKQFAYEMQAGGSWNIRQAFRYLFRLSSFSEIRAFYNLLDSRFNRNSLKQYREPTYCWTWWTRFAVSHRYLTTAIVGSIVSIPVFQKWLRKRRGSKRND